MFRGLQKRKKGGGEGIAKDRGAGVQRPCDPERKRKEGTAPGVRGVSGRVELSSPQKKKKGKEKKDLVYIAWATTPQMDALIREGTKKEKRGKKDTRLACASRAAASSCAVIKGKKKRGGREWITARTKSFLPLFLLKKKKKREGEGNSLRTRRG